MTDSPIGARLEATRMKRGESQDEVAEKVGVSQPTYSRWVLGQSLPKSAYWVKIGRYLGVTRDEVSRLVNASHVSTSARLDRIESSLADLTKAVEDLARRRR